MEQNKKTMQNGKHPSQSRSEFVQILRMANVNGAGRLFGGDLMKWFDEVSAICARRHSGHVVTTACVENLRFLRPAYQNDSMVVTARVVYTGKTSMDVLVTGEVEALDGSRTLIADAHIILVCLDENERPCPVPPILPETDEEWAYYREAEAKRASGTKH